MQEIILTCDLCKAAEREAKRRRRKPSYAVATLDVCEAHHRRYGPRARKGAGGRPRQYSTVAGESAVERRKRVDRERHRAKNQAKREAREREAKAARPRPGQGKGGGVKKGTELVPWLERETVVLSLIPAVGRVSTQRLWEQVQHLAPEKRLVRSRVHEVLKRLKRKGLVTQFGNRVTTEYARANGPVES